MKPATARLRILLIAAAVAASAPAAHAETYFGKFIGKFVAEFDEEGGGRKVTLMEPYGFIDPYGKEWNVPTGYKTDGASVPAALWALYPPFTGNYRSAAVIHDYYCDNKDRTWQDTHKVFYFAMRAAHVDETTAKVMYSAVYLFGPRWGPGTQPGQHSAADPGHAGAAGESGERPASAGGQGQPRPRRSPERGQAHRPPGNQRLAEEAGMIARAAVPP